jgi:hypothetical protein
MSHIISLRIIPVLSTFQFFFFFFFFFFVFQAVPSQIFLFSSTGGLHAFLFMCSLAIYSIIILRDVVPFSKMCGKWNTRLF